MVAALDKAASTGVLSQLARWSAGLLSRRPRWAAVHQQRPGRRRLHGVAAALDKVASRMMSSELSIMASLAAYRRKLE